jgi:glycosyltransferase involved in cell wall biosynthesis
VPNSKTSIGRRIKTRVDESCLMRILQILHDDQRGGVQKLAAMIEAGLLPHNVTFETVYLYPGPGLSIVSKLGHTFSLVRRIWRGDFDAIVAYQSTASILTGAVGWACGCPLRVVHQTCLPSETALPLRLMDKLVGTLGLYSANIVNSAATWAEFARYPARYRRSVVLIEHGLDAPAPTHQRETTRRHFNLPLSQPVILNVGRLAAEKNQDILIRALACLPQAHLVLAGAGLKMAPLHDLAVTLGVDDRLHMPGALPPDDIADLYAAADLAVFPSIWETFGFAAVEAAMTGMPLVVADLPALREVLRWDGLEPVAFVSPSDVEGWILAIRNALADPPSRPALAAYTRAIRRKYSLQRMIESYQSLFTAPTQRAPRPLAELHAAAEEGGI